MLKLSHHLRRIETAERDIAALQNRSSTKEDLTQLRREMKHALVCCATQPPSGVLWNRSHLMLTQDAQHMDMLQLKSHLWGIEQDLSRYSQTEQTRIKI